LLEDPGIRIFVNSSSGVTFSDGGGENKCSRVCANDGGGKKANASAHNRCCNAVATATILRIIDIVNGCGLLSVKHSIKKAILAIIPLETLYSLT